MRLARLPEDFSWRRLVVITALRLALIIVIFISAEWITRELLPPLLAIAAPFLVPALVYRRFTRRRH